MKALRPTIGLVALGIALVALAPGVLAGQSAVSIVDRSFDPTSVTVNVGDTVVWTVTKAIADPHSVTSGTPGDAASGQQFDSGIKLRNNGDTFSKQFDTAGVFPYYCQVHPTEMRGTITVLAAGETAGPSASAGPQTSGTPAASAAPAASGASPAASAAPSGGEARAPIGTTEKLAAAAVIGVALVILFAAARLYRRASA